MAVPSVGTATWSWSHFEFVDCLSVVRSRGLQTSIYYVKYWSASYWSVTFHHTWSESRPGEESGRYCGYWRVFGLTHTNSSSGAKVKVWLLLLCRGIFPLCSHVYSIKRFSVRLQTGTTPGQQGLLAGDCSGFTPPVWLLINKWKQLWTLSIQSTLSRVWRLKRGGEHQSDPVLEALLHRPWWALLFLVEGNYSSGQV